MVAHELFHFQQKKKKGGKTYCALKIDMQKVYDRVDWRFLKETLQCKIH